MGQTQFMPSTFLTYAVDFDGDGRKDLWNSPADALASAAKYLKASGYIKDMPWGIEVLAPADSGDLLHRRQRREQGRRVRLVRRLRERIDVQIAFVADEFADAPPGLLVQLQ